MINYRTAPQRKVVAWYESEIDPNAAIAFARRGFVVQRYENTDDLTPDRLAGICAVVLVQDKRQPEDPARFIEREGERLLEFECNIIVRYVARRVQYIMKVADKGELPIDRLPFSEAPGLAEAIWRRQRKDMHPGDLPRPHIRLYAENIPWDEIANYEMEHLPGAAPNASVKIDMARGHSFDEELRILFSRAFHEFSEVHLLPISGGRSGAQTFLALANATNRRPLPYFVKTGPWRQILAEYDNYEDHVASYVPFHLGPNLDHGRCCLGAHQGVLVCDFVEESESLLECARAGRAGGAIACLFERTLRGWHHNESTWHARPFDVIRIPERLGAERWDRALKLGAKFALNQHQEELASCPKLPFLWGQIHGDLHASNIRVRGTDAILIDFLQCRNGPLICDAAALEASLFVGSLGRSQHDDAKLAQDEQLAGFEAWRTSMLQLYIDAPIDRIPKHAMSKDEWAWFHRCVRQIRSHALHMEQHPGQYAIALAAAMFFKASKDDGIDEPERSSRALAYVIGDHLMHVAIKKLRGKSATA